MTLDELLLSFRNYYGSYHHHKENMAYTAATLYLSVATAVVVKGIGLWALASACLVIALLLSSCVICFLFVGWQLYQRAVAADIVMACTSVATALLTQPPNGTPNVSPARYRGISFPQVLVDELNSIAQNRTLLGGPRPGAITTFLAMAVWSIAALVAIRGTA